MDDNTLLTMAESADEAAKLGHQYNAGSLANAAAAWQNGDEAGLKSIKKGKTHLTTFGDLKTWLADARRGQVGPKPRGGNILGNGLIRGEKPHGKP